MPERSVSLYRAHGGGSTHNTEEGRRNTLGQHNFTWGRDDPNKYPAHVLANGSFPLWDGRDVREIPGAEGPNLNHGWGTRPPPGVEAMYGGAYHLHNWFADLGILRMKYATYGHFNHKAATMSLSHIEGDIGMVVRRVYERGVSRVPADPHDGVAGGDHRGLRGDLRRQLVHPVFPGHQVRQADKVAVSGGFIPQATPSGG